MKNPITGTDSNASYEDNFNDPTLLRRQSSGERLSTVFFKLVDGKVKEVGFANESRYTLFIGSFDNEKFTSFETYGVNE